jgi:hypothetical protein
VGLHFAGSLSVAVSDGEEEGSQMKSNLADTSIGNVLDMIPIEFKYPGVRTSFRRLTKDLEGC